MKSNNELKMFCEKNHLLYIEDNENARFFTLEFLSRFFVQISEAKDGAEGFECYQNRAIDLIIADIHMPTIDGIEMTKRVRMQNRNIPIILLTAHSEEDIKNAAFNAGADFYMEKPLDVFQFIKTMKQIMEK